MIARAVILVALAASLAACDVPPGQTPQPEPKVAPVAVQAPADDCAVVGTMVDDLVARKASGLTEREALAELSARGDFRLGYVVDGVFQAKPDQGAALLRGDILATCRRVNKTGTAY